MASQADFFAVWDKITKRRSVNSPTSHFLETSKILLEANRLIEASGINPKDYKAQVPGLDRMIRQANEFLRKS